VETLTSEPSVFYLSLGGLLVIDLAVVMVVNRLPMPRGAVMAGLCRRAKITSLCYGVAIVLSVALGAISAVVAVAH